MSLVAPVLIVQRLVEMSAVIKAFSHRCHAHVPFFLSERHCLNSISAPLSYLVKCALICLMCV